MSSTDEPFEGQNSQFGDQPPAGPSGNLPPYGQQPPPPYGQPSPYGQSGAGGQGSIPPYGQQGGSGQPDPYGSPSPYGAPSPSPYGSSQFGSSGQSPYGQPSPWLQPMGPPPPNYLAWSIVVTVLCCLPLGIPAIVYASQVSSKWAAGDSAGAYHSSKQAKLFTIWSAALGGVFVVGYVALVVMGVIAEY